jgi:hypothetical protein
MFRRMEGQTENFTPRGLLHPKVTKFTPRENFVCNPMKKSSFSLKLANFGQKSTRVPQSA